MIRLAEHSISINASPSQVWQVLVDIPHIQEWDVGMDWMKLRKGIVPGAWGLVKKRSGPIALLRIGEVRPLHDYVSTLYVLWMRIVIDHRLEECPDGTHITFTIDAAGFGSSYFDRFFGNQFRQGLPLWLENLKNRLEREASVPQKKAVSDAFRHSVAATIQKHRKTFEMLAKPPAGI